MSCLKTKQYKLGLNQSLRASFMAALVLMPGCVFQGKRPSYSDPDRLVSVVKVLPEGESPILGAEFLALRSESKNLESIAGYAPRGVILTEGEPERICSAQVTADFFPTLGIRPILGRTLLAVDNQPDSTPVVVINHTLWQRRFGADPNLVGRTISLDRAPHIVVGVMPSDFQLPKECDVWTLLVFDDQSRLGEDKSLALEVFARLRPGVTLEQAQDEMRLIGRKFEVDYPETKAGRDIKLTALRESSSQIENVKGKALEIKIHRPADLSVETGKEK